MWVEKSLHVFLGRVRAMTDETIFAAALEKPTPAERSAFLDEACAGDAALRRED